jgi:hypothetical protein
VLGRGDLTVLAGDRGEGRQGRIDSRAPLTLTAIALTLKPDVSKIVTSEYSAVGTDVRNRKQSIVTIDCVTRARR